MLLLLPPMGWWAFRCRNMASKERDKARLALEERQASAKSFDKVTRQFLLAEILAEAHGVQLNIVLSDILAKIAELPDKVKDKMKDK